MNKECSVAEAVRGGVDPNKVSTGVEILLEGVFPGVVED